MSVKDCLWLITSIVIFVIAIVNCTNSTIDIISNSSSIEKSTGDHFQKLIHKYPIVIFSKSYCRYSSKAKSILSKSNLGENYYILELDQISNADDYLMELEKLTGDRTVPRIFIGGKYMGDEDDLANLEKQGDLERLLKNTIVIK